MSDQRWLPGMSSLIEARERDDLELVEECLVEQFVWCRDRNDSQGMASLLADRGTNAVRCGALARAEDLYERCLTLYRQMKYDGDVALMLVVLGSLAQRRQLLDRAAQCFEEALAIYRVQLPAAAAWKDRSMARALRGLGDLARGQGDVPRATAHYEQSLVLYAALAESPGPDLVHHVDDREEAQGLVVLLRDMACTAQDWARAAAFDARFSTLQEEWLGSTPRLFGAMAEDERRAGPGTGPADPRYARLGRRQRWWQRLFIRRPCPR